MRSEEEIINEIETYIKSLKRNRPSFLASLKKASRTPKIIDMIFSKPDVFKLDSEIKHVPSEYLTEEVLIKYILASPQSIANLDENLITVPVLVAFEFSKRRYERFSAMTWGKYKEKIAVFDIYKKHRDDIWKLCDKLPSKHYDEDITGDYLYYIDKVSREIIELCKPIEELSETENNYVPKYREVDFGLDKRLLILISGYPDSGKTTFANLLDARQKILYVLTLTCF